MSDVSREDLLKKLRDKRRGKRDAAAGPQLAQRLRDDPVQAMLELGLDDPQLLSNAKSIVKNPQAALTALLSTDDHQPAETSSNANNRKCKKKKKKKPTRRSDEEPPPCDVIDTDDEEPPPL